jgi:hypothetical protein
MVKIGFGLTALLMTMYRAIRMVFIKYRLLNGKT